MTTSRLIQGRSIESADIDRIRGIISEHPGWSRRRISVAVCESFEWRSPSGQLRDMSARLLLNKLAGLGEIDLPARQKRGGQRIPRAALQSEGDLFADLQAEPIEAALGALQPLEVVVVEARQRESASFISHLARHHYLGFGGVAGQNLRYLVRDRQGRDLACVLFGAAAWKVKARDAFIGWTRQQREARLGLIVNNSRFLILPQVRVPHLASHILGLIARRLRADWRSKYACEPCLAETFVERERFEGTCYRAANWLCIGETAGRTRQDRDHSLSVPVKSIHLYPLTRHFKAILCA